MKILILGANGMIGSAMMTVLSNQDCWNVVGSVRNENSRRIFKDSLHSAIISGGDYSNSDNLTKLISDVCPDVVINCAGVTKHVPEGNSPICALNVNALLPHRLDKLCKLLNARLIHVSTDCVFSGKVGNYRETDIPDALDIYGKTKHLGEVASQNSLTLRTSTIGHESGTRHGLLEWFLQQKECKGYERAVFSGLPSVEFARIIKDFIIPNKNLTGLYHIAAEPINKYQLLQLIASEYKKDIIIIPDDKVVIDRSLNGSLFNTKVGYKAADWPNLIHLMRQHQIKR